ncbi:MAG: hypothetical protein KUG60_01505 [Gammaproteobacteria bacterium]|nr:hypothetical protein [Gammaproteobacteria bacterium]
MSNEMIRELDASEIDMVSGGFTFTGGFGLDGSSSITTSFDSMTFGFELGGSLFEGLGGSISNGISNILGNLLGGLFG